MSQPGSGKPSRALDSTEEHQCRSATEWARLYISKNPDEHALGVVAAYGKSRWDRLGPLTIDQVQDLQAELGLLGLSPELLVQQRAQASRRRSEHVERVELFLQMRPEEMAALSDRDLSRAALLQLGARSENGTTRTQVTAIGRRVLAASMLDADVKNGGFSQYFHNADAADVGVAVDGLRMIGAQPFADVAERAATCRAVARASSFRPYRRSTRLLPSCASTSALGGIDVRDS